MKRSLSKFIIPALLLAVASSCKKDHPVTIAPIGAYENGFFIVNEGNYGHDHGGTVTFYDYNSGKLTDSTYTKVNAGKTFDPNTSSLEFGAVYNKKLYLLTKSGGPLVVADAGTLKESNRIAAAAPNDWRAFVGLSTSTGLVSTSTGIYPLDLNAVTLGNKIAGVTGEVGDMVVAGKYIFALSATDGIVVLNSSDYSVAKTISGVSIGFAKTTDGIVWAAGGTNLYRIDPASLSVTTVTLPFTVYDSWYAWHAGSIVASTNENAVFILNNQQYEGGTDIYKYVVSNAGSVSKPFITLASGLETYGKGIGYDSKLNQLVVTTVHTNYDFNDNDLIFYNPATGASVKDMTFTGNYFPAETVFH